MKSAYLLIIFFFSLGLEAKSIVVQVKSPSGALKGQSVELFLFEEGKPQSTKTAKTGVDGKARFDFSSADRVTAAARTVYQNVNYFSDMVLAQNNTVLAINVFPTTTDLKNLRIKELQIFASPIEEGLMVDQEWLVENPTQSTMVGALRSTLPANSFDLQLIQGFAREQTQFEGNDLITSTPFLPGETRYSLSFKVETKRMHARFEQKFSVPLSHISLGLAKDLKIQSPGFTSAGRKIFNEEWVELFETSPSNSTEVSISLGGLPLNLRFSQWAPWLIVTLLLLMTWILPKSSTAPMDAHEEARHLDELLYLDRARQEKIISETEYQLRRLPLLEKLMNTYASS